MTSTRSSDSIVRLRHLAVGYAHRPVASQLDAALESGTLCALLAPNGRGKSTLLRTMAALQRPVEGMVEWGGRDATLMTPGEMARTVSIVLTLRPEAPSLSVRQVVEMGRIPYAGCFRRITDDDRQRVDEALSLTQTEALADRRIGTLSDGERQRVFVAKALAQATPAILLDEPTAFLDFPSKVEMFRLLSRLAHNEGRTIVVSTHDVELALQFADHLWLLDHLGIVAGTPQELAADGSIGRFFQAEGLCFDSSSLRFVLDTCCPHQKTNSSNSSLSSI